MVELCVPKLPVEKVHSCPTEPEDTSGSDCSYAEPQETQLLESSTHQVRQWQHHDCNISVLLSSR